MVRRVTKLPSVPKLVTKDNQLAKFAAAVHELMDVWRGNKNRDDKVVTFGDLAESGGFSYRGAPSANAASGLVFTGETTLDTTPPARVQNVIIDPAMTSVFITWDALSQTNIAYYEIWRNSVNTFDGNELRIGTSITSMYSDAIGDTKKTYYYWVRAVSIADITGPYNATIGLFGATAAVALTDFASGLTPVEIVGSLPTTGNFEGRQALLTTDEKLYRYVSGSWSNAVDGGDISNNSIVTGSISTGAIKAAQIDAGAVTALKIAAGSITADRMNVIKLSAISANLGSITGGSLNIGGSKFVVDSLGNTTIRSGFSGNRLVMTNSVIKVYDSSNILRIKIGNLNA